MEIIKDIIENYWKNLVIIILLCLVCCSCSVQKTQEKTETKETIETFTTRIGDTVRFEVPNVIFKDTVIYRKNIQGTILKTVYNKEGKVTSIDCMASKFDELKRENREIKELLKHKEKKTLNNLLLFLGFIIFISLILFIKK